MIGKDATEILKVAKRICRAIKHCDGICAQCDSKQWGCIHVACELCDANCEIVKDDEMVIKKSRYAELKKYETDWLNDEKMHLQAELEDTEFELGCSNRLFQKVCEEKKELEEQLERYKNKAKYYYNECKSYGNACYIDNDLEDIN